ncbi:MAG TPA: SCO family protein, partial [Xanthobacteraceae bacterium]
MTLRHIRLLTMLAAFVAGLVLSLGVLVLVREHMGRDVPQAASIGGPFRLMDQDGRTVTEEDLKGRPSLVFFGFTHCPDVCPTTLFDISQIMHVLGPEADRTRAVFITVDPERDTQSVLKDYLTSFDPHVSGLTGDLPAITKVAKEYRAYFKKVPLDGGEYTMDHTA